MTVSNLDNLGCVHSVLQTPRDQHLMLGNVIFHYLRRRPSPGVLPYFIALVVVLEAQAFSNSRLLFHSSWVQIYGVHMAPLR